MSNEIFLAGGARTAIGSFAGSLADVPAPTLGSTVARAAIQRAGAHAQDVDEVIFGNVIGAGLGQNVARQVAIGAGLAASVGATTVNKVCGSGLKAVMLAAQAVRCGDSQLVVAGGCENMSAAPYLLRKARGGYRMGHGELIDAMIHDGLWDIYHNKHMGTYGDACAEQCALSREQQDDFAVASYQRAQAAQRDGRFAQEIVPVEIVGRKGVVVLEKDEEPLRFDEQKLRTLKPAFGPGGTVTAGNASSINDGAAAIVVLSSERAERLGIQPQGAVAGYAAFAQEPEWFTLAPIGAIHKLLSQLGWTSAEVDLFEINEAFSVVPLAAMKDLNIPHDKVNVRGGAVALGHPIGASGARVLVTLLAGMQERNARKGVASLCIGGGEAVALAVTR